MIKKSILFLFLGSSLILAQNVIRIPGIGGKAGAEPPPVSGPKLWLSADCITYSGGSCSVPANGTNITTWDDRSGNTNNGTVASGTATFNTNVINGKPALSFTSVHMNLTSNAPPLSNGPVTAFAVYYPPAGPYSVGATILSSDSRSSFDWYINGSFKQNLDKDSDTGCGTGTNALSLTTWHQLNVSFPNDLTATIFRLDKAVDGTTGSCGLMGGSKTIGWNGYNGGTPSGEKIAELIVYNTVLSLSDKQLVETYFNTKYGL